MIDDLMKAYIEEEDEYIDNDLSYRNKPTSSEKHCKDSFPKDMKPNSYIYKNRMLTIACNTGLTYERGRRLSRRNRLIFLSDLLKKDIKVKYEGDICKIQIEDVSSEEEVFILKFIKDNFTIKV